MKPLYVVLIEYEGYTEFRTEDGRWGSEPCDVEETKRRLQISFNRELEFEVL